jgi:hypothetical protein
MGCRVVGKSLLPDIGEFQVEFAASGSGGTTPWTGAAQTCAIFQVHYTPRSSSQKPWNEELADTPNDLPTTYQKLTSRALFAVAI